MRTIVNISMPAETAKEAKRIAHEEGFVSVSEYFRYLLREEKERKLAKELHAQTLEFKKGKGIVLRSLRDLR